MLVTYILVVLRTADTWESPGYHFVLMLKYKYMPWRTNLRTNCNNGCTHTTDRSVGGIINDVEPGKGTWWHPGRCLVMPLIQRDSLYIDKGAFGAFPPWQIKDLALWYDNHWQCSNHAAPTGQKKKHVLFTYTVLPREILYFAYPRFLESWDQSAGSATIQCPWSRQG